jgi:two-component system chemotaxis response regulator CheB
VAQHQPPSAAPELLSDLLARRTSLRVAVAVDGAALTPGLVLVAPPGHHVLIQRNETIALIEAGAVPQARTSADIDYVLAADLSGDLLIKLTTATLL